MPREIRTEKYAYNFSTYFSPIDKVVVGEPVIIFTEDAYSGVINEETDLPSKKVRNFNPQTGPIYIEGAEPGDTLIVSIIDIEFTRDFAISAMVPYFGGLTSTNTTRTLNDPLPEKVWFYKLVDDKFVNNEHLVFSPDPFLGTIATAPENLAISTLTPFEQGGNMDVPDVKAGNKVYLPVKVPGAYFFMGDCHAIQGHGELCGSGLEISAKTTLKFDLIKGKSISWPRIESPNEYMTIGSARPMEDAARIAYYELLSWLVEFGWDKYEAYQLLSQVGKLYVGNMVDTVYSLVAKVDKHYVNQHK